MSDVLDLTVHGDPAACRAAAQDAAGAREAVTRADERIRRALSEAAAWRGLTASGFETRTQRAGRDLRELDDRIEALERALTDFAGEITTVESRMAEARRVGLAGGVAVSGDTLLRPTALQAANQEEADAHERTVAAWNEAVEIAEAARRKEQEAHQHLVDGVRASTGDGFLTDLLQRLGVLPPDFADGDDLGAYLFGVGSRTFGVGVNWMVHVRYGRFQPWGGTGFGSARGMSFWQRAWSATDERSFFAKPYRSAARNTWQTAGKWGTRVGTTVTAVTAGWNQWQADADDPSMGGAERGTRAATQGVATAAGAWGGAKVGGMAGAAIGTAICPGVGTVVGATVGGLVGGVAGGAAGDWIGDQLVDPIGDAAEAASEWVGEAADGVGETVSDVGDALTFWD